MNLFKKCFLYHSMSSIDSFWVLRAGRPATICPSIPHSLDPLLILKNPLFPQSSFHELATNQYGFPL
jgi:hypothetical protein